MEFDCGIVFYYSMCWKVKYMGHKQESSEFRNKLCMTHVVMLHASPRHTHIHTHIHTQHHTTQTHTHTF